MTKENFQTKLNLYEAAEFGQDEAFARLIEALWCWENFQNVLEYCYFTHRVNVLIFWHDFNVFSAPYIQVCESWAVERSQQIRIFLIKLRKDGLLSSSVYSYWQFHGVTNLQGGSLGTKHTIQQLTYLNNHNFVKTYSDRFLNYSFKYYLLLFLVLLLVIGPVFRGWSAGNLYPDRLCPGGWGWREGGGCGVVKRGGGETG